MSKAPSQDIADAESTLTPTVSSAGPFEAWTGGALNIVKILAIVAAGAWTWHEWNVSIFPRVTKEQLVETARARTDLAASVSDVKLDALAHNRGQTLIASGRLAFENHRDFPVEVRPMSASIRVGKAREDSRLAVDWDWSHGQPVAIEEIIGTDSPVVVESTGAISFPAQFVANLEWSASSRWLQAVSVEVVFELSALDPLSGAPINGAKKTKRLLLRGIAPHPESSEQPIMSSGLFSASIGDAAAQLRSILRDFENSDDEVAFRDSLQGMSNRLVRCLESSYEDADELRTILKDVSRKP